MSVAVDLETCHDREREVGEGIRSALFNQIESKGGKVKQRPKKWTAAFLANLPPHVLGASSSYTVTDPVVTGLTLQIGTTGRKIFWWRATYRGEKIAVRIGELGPISIAVAQTKAYELRAILDTGRDPRAERNQQKLMPLVREFAKDYIDHVTTRKRSYKDDEAKLRDWILPVLGDFRMGDVSIRDIQKLLGDLHGKLSPATINRVHALLSVFFNLSVSWKQIPANPCAGQKKLLENNRRERFLSPEEVRRIISAADKDFNIYAAGVVKIALLVGLRKDEILKIRIENFDAEKGVLFLPHTKNGRSRHVAINDSAVEILKNLPRVPESPWIFPGARDAQKPLCNVTKAWQRILVAAQVEKCCLHTARHSFASMLVNEGATLYQTQHLLGHLCHSTTQRYAHVASAAQRNTAQLVADLINKTDTL